MKALGTTTHQDNVPHTEVTVVEVAVMMCLATLATVRVKLKKKRKNETLSNKTLG